METAFDFDRICPRKGTHCVKWDAEPMQKDGKLLPLFVADMDFETAPVIKEALAEAVAHGIYGYTMVWPEYLQAVGSWMKNRHNMDVKSEWIIAFPGVVPAVKHAVRTYTNPGDEVLIFKPVYYPFDSSIEDNSRKIAAFALEENEGVYSIDFDKLEAYLQQHNVRLLIFCSPHNPIGKVWSPDELEQLARLMKKHDILVFSDEIHMDFTHAEKPFHSMLEYAPLLENRLIVATAPSKTFNLAGLQTSNIIIENEALRSEWKAEMDRVGISAPNKFGLIAAEAAYTQGEAWLDSLLDYIDGNFIFMQDWFAGHMPMVSMRKPEGLYLAWADFRDLGMDARELEDFMLNEAHVWLDKGYIFGEGGEGFERFNCACPRAVLQEALERIETAWNNRQS